MEDKNKDKDDEFGFLVHCDVCARDLTHMLHLSCAVCAGLSAGIINGSNTNGSNINGVLGGDGSGGGGSSMGTETETGAAIAIDAEPFDLCVSCFASGAQPKTHRRTHDYLVKEGLDWPLFDAKWTAHEELLLVDGLKLYGIGNWDQISTHIGTKSKEELDAHYRSVYCASESWPIPNMSIEFDKFSTRKYICRDPNPPLRKPERSCTSGPANHEIQGYMPGRDEFDHEFEHEAENPVKDMAFEDHDTPEEISLKTTMLNIYNMYLDRRIERKKFLKDRNIMFDFKKQQNIEKKRSKDERDLLGRIRVFAKLQTAADFEDFSEGMLREQRLRARISLLQEFRRMGVTNFSDASAYERDKLSRAQYKAAGLSRVAGRPPPPIRGQSSTIPRAFSSTSLNFGSPTVTAGPTGGNIKKALNPLDISSSDGVDLLLPNEQQLCSNLRILPRAYLMIKETLLRHYAEQGGLSRKEARRLIKIDVLKTQQIYDLFVINGWIQFTI